MADDCATTLIVFHRCGGKSLGYPPNTSFSAEWAISQGAQAIEYDVVMASESGEGGRLVVIEPKLLNALDVDINHLRWEDIRSIDAGNTKFGSMPLTLLEDMLAVAEERVAQQIHIKGEGNPEIVPALLSALRGKSDFVITAFDIEVLKRIKALAPDVKLGWLVKPAQEKGGEGTTDLTARVTANPESASAYGDEEVAWIIQQGMANKIDMLLLCAPRIQSKNLIDKVRATGMKIGAWGVGENISLAQKLIALGLDRFTIDNPEQLT